MNKTFSIGNITFEAQAEAGIREVSLRQASSNGGVSEYEITFRFGEPDEPCKASVSWHMPMFDVLAFWSPSCGRDHSVRQWFAARENKSSLSCGAPVLSLYHQGGLNAHTVAVSEAERHVRMLAYVDDSAEKDHLAFRIDLFEDSRPQDEAFSLRLRLDERALPFESCVADVSEWWKAFYPNPRKTGGPSEDALYSSWYACHQNPTQSVLERELEIAAEVGLRAMILDDGWSYDGPGTGDYFNCGSWAVVPSKFPDFKAFVDKAHALGIRVALWFPVPFVGRNNPDFETFKNKLLADRDHYRAGILDPRYPEVREYITNSYIQIVHAYALDGLKLDFIDSIHAPNAPIKPGMDCSTVVEGVSRLLHEIDVAFTRDNPDFMLEFRQMYIGPSIIRHCNMLRVGDCAFDPLTNRVGVVNLRMMNYPLAVHSDMYMWDRAEKPEACARMLENTLFGVPQISVLMQHSSPEQIQVIKSFVSYWTEHRELLLHGKLSVCDPELNYSAVSAEDDSLRITALYAFRPVIFDGKTTHVFNVTSGNSILVDVQHPCEAVCVDCYGNEHGRAELYDGPNHLNVPSAGMVILTAK